MNLIDLTSDPAPCLRGVALERETKQILVDMAHRKGSSYRSVTERYNLNYNTLRGYCKRFRRGKLFQKTRGRPLKLDNESDKNILAWMRDNPTWNRSDLKARIKSEMVLTHNRRFPGGFNDENIPRMSKTTVFRYQSRLENAYHDSFE